MTFQVRYIEKQYSEMIQETLTPQFLGLWVKLCQEGCPPDVVKRGMALALFRTTSYLNETKDLADDADFLNMIDEIREILVKYENIGMHYGKLSAGLEYLITLVLGTTFQEDKK